VPEVVSFDDVASFSHQPGIVIYCVEYELKHVIGDHWRQIFPEVLFEEAAIEKHALAVGGLW